MEIPEVEEPEVAEEPIPDTPHIEVNGFLCQLCEQNRRTTGNHSIIWRRVIHFLRVQFPDLEATDEQIRNRYNLLVRNAQHLALL